MIEGISVLPLRVIRDERGMVMHMLRCDSPNFTRFGEIYFSVVNPQVVKAWKKHLKMTQHFAVPSGKIRLVLYDSRVDSRTYGTIETHEIGEDNYCLIRIPPMIWYGFKGISPSPAMVANCADMPHSPDEALKLESTDLSIPYSW